MNVLAPGLHYGIEADVYHADPAPLPSLSSSLAKLLLDRSPAHAWVKAPRLNPDWEPENSKVFDIGRAAHRSVLGSGSDYAVIPEEMLASNGAASTKEAKAFIEDCRERGVTPLKAAEADQVGAMAAVARVALAEMGITLDPAMSEVGVIAEIDGIWCRAMVDNVPAQEFALPGGNRKVLIDFKTVEDASPASCRRAIENYGYDVQMQHYLETWKAATGEDRAFLFVFQEKSPPYEVGVVLPLTEPGHSADWQEDAADKISEARQTWGQCLRTGQWPGYPRQIIQVGAQPYFRQGWQDTAMRTRFTRSALERAAAWQSPMTLAGE